VGRSDLCDWLTVSVLTCYCGVAEAYGKMNAESQCTGSVLKCGVWRLWDMKDLLKRIEGGKNEKRKKKERS